jgi:hypothetical protein
MPRGFRHPAACRSVRDGTPIVNHVEISVDSVTPVRLQACVHFRIASHRLRGARTSRCNGKTARDGFTPDMDRFALDANRSTAANVPAAAAGGSGTG